MDLIDGNYKVRVEKQRRYDARWRAQERGPQLGTRLPAAIRRLDRGVRTIAISKSGSRLLDDASCLHGNLATCHHQCCTVRCLTEKQHEGSNLRNASPARIGDCAPEFALDRPHRAAGPARHLAKDLESLENSPKNNIGVTKSI
jgi:hypothetical protein